MEPIKFEDDCREKLNRRSLTPSKEAWEKLSTRLDTANSSTNKSIGLWWMAIAASFVVGLFIASQLMSSKQTDTPPAIVGTPTIVDTLATDEHPEKKPQAIDNKINNSSNKLSTEEILANSKFEKKRPENKSKGNIKSGTIQLAKNQPISKEKEEKDVFQNKNVGNLNFENEKIQELASAINTLNKTQKQVSDTTIDSLLKQAQKDILLNRMKNEDKVLVDAALLLQDVELELDQSFRDKVFKALKENYGWVKTAIAQRNQ